MKCLTLIIKYLFLADVLVLGYHLTFGLKHWQMYLFRGSPEIIESPCTRVNMALKNASRITLLCKHHAQNKMRPYS